MNPPALVLPDSSDDFQSRIWGSCVAVGRDSIVFDNLHGCETRRPLRHDISIWLCVGEDFMHGHPMQELYRVDDREYGRDQSFGLPHVDQELDPRVPVGLRQRTGDDRLMTAQGLIYSYQDERNIFCVQRTE